MHVIKNMLVSAALMMGGVSLAIAQDSQHAHDASGKAPDTTDTAVGSNLPPKLRTLLIQEMLALSDAS